MGETLTASVRTVGRAEHRVLRAVAYLRVSTDEQVQGNGIAYTARRALRHIEKKGWEHVGTYSDEGLSGALGADERADLARLMEEARKTPRPFDVVVVYEERAMGRTGRAFWPWVWELEDGGVYVAIVKGDYDNTTDEGRSRMRKAQDKAEDERSTLRDRTNGGRDERARNGGYVGGKVPYGYRVEGPAKARVLVVDECSEGAGCERRCEADTLRRVRQVFVDPAQGKGNWRTTAILINAEGYTTRDGKPWREANLRARVMSPTVLEARQVFRNPMGKHTAVDPAGNPLYGETVVIELDAIFTPEEIKELKQADARRPPRAPKSGGRVYTMSKRIIGQCGAYYTGFGREGDTSRYYRCSGATEAFAGSGRRCKCPRLNADVIESYVWGQVRKFLGDEARLKILAEQHVGHASAGKADFAARIEELEQRITTLRRTIMVTSAMSVRQAIEMGMSDAEAESLAAESVRPLRAELSEVASLRDEVAAWQQETLQAGQRAWDLRSLAKLAHHSLERLTSDQQAELLALLDIKATIVGDVPQGRAGSPCSLWKFFRDSGRDVPDLTDEAWAVVSPLITSQGHTLSRRSILAGLLHKARTGCRWHELPSKYGHYRGVQTQLKRWRASGVWEQIMEALEPFSGTPPVGRDLTPPVRLTGVLIPELLLGSNAHLTERPPPASAPPNA